MAECTVNSFMKLNNRSGPSVAKLVSDFAEVIFTALYDVADPPNNKPKSVVCYVLSLFTYVHTCTPCVHVLL